MFELNSPKSQTLLGRERRRPRARSTPTVVGPYRRTAAGRSGLPPPMPAARRRRRPR